MPTKEMTARDAKIVQYLNDAYATERRLEIALQAHIAMTPRADYKQRLREHLKETKGHARLVARRIKALGGEAETMSLPGPDAVVKGATGAKAAVQRAAAMAQGPLHAVRGTGQQERMLKNARTEYQDEAEEIATYRVIEALAKAVGDKETAKLARDIGREEKKMADFLVGLIDQLALFAGGTAPAPAPSFPSAIDEPDEATMPAFERRALLRDKRHRLVADLRRSQGGSHAEINRWLNRSCGVRRVEDASIEQLERSIDLLLGRLSARR